MLLTACVAKKRQSKKLKDFREQVVKEARERLKKKGIEEVCLDRINEIKENKNFDMCVKSIVDDSIAFSWY